MVTHQLAEVDIILFMYGGKRGGDDDVYPSPTFTLSRGFSRRTSSFSLSRNNDFKVSIFERIFIEHP